MFFAKVFLEAVVQMCFVKKRLLEILQNSQEKTCARVSFLIKLQASGLKPATLLKKRLWHRFFPVHFVKFQEHFSYRIPLVAASIFLKKTLSKTIEL